MLCLMLDYTAFEVFHCYPTVVNNFFFIKLNFYLIIVIYDGYKSYFSAPNIKQIIRITSQYCFIKKVRYSKFKLEIKLYKCAQKSLPF